MKHWLILFAIVVTGTGPMPIYEIITQANGQYLKYYTDSVMHDTTTDNPSIIFMERSTGKRYAIYGYYRLQTTGDNWRLTKIKRLPPL